MQVEADRKVCCAGKCVSDACNEFCLNDIIYEKDAFKTCDGKTGIELHDCCAEWATGNEYKKYDCTSELIKGDCET